MNLSTSKKTAPISISSGLMLGLFLVLYTNYVTPSINAGIALFFQLVGVIVLGLIAGWILKDKIPNSYLVSSFALLFAYAQSILFAATKSVHYIIYIIVIAVSTYALFYASNVFFNRLNIGKAVKIILAMGSFIIIALVCSIVGLYISRLVASAV